MTGSGRWDLLSQGATSYCIPLIIGIFICDTWNTWYIGHASELKEHMIMPRTVNQCMLDKCRVDGADGQVGNLVEGGGRTDDRLSYGQLLASRHIDIVPGMATDCITNNISLSITKCRFVVVSLLNHHRKVGECYREREHVPSLSILLLSLLNHHRKVGECYRERAHVPLLSILLL